MTGPRNQAAHEQPSSVYDDMPKELRAWLLERAATVEGVERNVRDLQIIAVQALCEVRQRCPDIFEQWLAEHWPDRSANASRQAVDALPAQESKQ